MAKKNLLSRLRNVYFLSLSLAALIFSVDAEAQPLFALKKKPTSSQPWYKKVNYFSNVAVFNQSLSLSKQPVNDAVISDTFEGDSNTLEGRFSVGGKLFANSSIYGELTLDQTALKGRINRKGAANFSDSVDYHRYKSRFELFYEYALPHGFSGGIDLYLGSERYQHRENHVTDKEFGGALLLSHVQYFHLAHLDFDYVMSYRKLNFGSTSLVDTSQVYHSLLAEYGHHFSEQLTGYIGGRFSVFPNYNKQSYWGSSRQYVLMSEVEYRLTSSSLVAVKYEKLWLSKNRYTHTVSAQYEYKFGSKKTKRRKRKYKTPNLLIR
ncbi:hypothetical protein [Pseudoalteromonas luteoviolacea]|uniref:Uncharacterized protein n=1 Tax=Pseudoalteromonas luteoviolacea (strain 2ta16) TaxID=1353533 RepID=V4HQZ4_PSEL2|nr:hypothetical protein [Pseudoalteromonas luteoviolacea]ESP93260.1 hypothetical protein PL2TA16_03481 [Pseudoalteromonas luteoviolacea 2ta16]KZN36621.1 hypothetical protein N483_22135 [Pseudoalteromonas luteoviolacea NCIMB 1944]